MKAFEKIDPKFKFNDKEADGELDYYSIPHPAFEMRGIDFYGEEGFLRMPKEVGESVSDDVAALNHHTTGGRILFSTDSDVIEIKVTHDYLSRLRNVELSALGFVLIERRGGERRYVKIMPPDYKDDTGYCFSVELEGGMRDYILYFPVVGRVRTLKIGLSRGAAVHPLHIYNEKPIVYYGSSITQGFCAGRADNTYEAFIEKWSERDFINLGFSGSGKGEDAMIEYIASLDCSVFVSDFNHSGMDLEVFERQLFTVTKPEAEGVTFTGGESVREGKDYTFAMNGQTGKIVADRPVSNVKSVVAGAIIFVIVFIILWFIRM